MTSFGLYYRPDCTMWAVQKSANARFADGNPARPLHSSNLRCLDLCCKREAETTRWGLVEQSTRQWSWIASLNCAAFIGGH